MRFPVIHQHDANDCGPACLAMVSAFYGKRQSLADLRERAGTDRQGTNLAGLVRAAAAIGFRPRAVRANAQALDHLRLPAIAHWSEHGRNHFVVVYRHGKRRVVLGDPAVGRRRLARSTFAAHWTGNLLLLEPGSELRSLATAPLATLWRLVRGHEKLFLDSLAAGSLATVLGLASAFFIRALVDLVIPSGRVATLDWLGIGMLLVLTLRSAMLGLRRYLLARLGQRIDADLVLGYHHHVSGLPLRFFSTRRTGEILARIQDAVRIRTALASTAQSVVIDSMTLFVASGAMFWLDWKLALTGLSLMPVLACLVAALTPGMRRAQQAAMERSAEFQAHAVEMIDAIETIRTARAEQRIRLRGADRFSRVMDAAFRSEVHGLSCSTAAAFISGLSALGLLWIGGRATLAGRITTGDLMALYTLFGTIVSPVERLAGANQIVQEALIASERVGEVLSLPGERATGIDREIEGRIAFRDVRFRHGHRPLLFDGLTLDIAAGECCRISGPSGSGKSTLVRLVVRLYEPEAGSVLVDGIDVCEYSLESLRRQVLLVSQESRILAASIEDNIRLGSSDATPEQVRSAASAAGADDFIRASPCGYDTLVGERGVSLSGGERQRLVLSRAILNDPAVLILDEPTNHLDPTSVRAVTRLIEERKRRRRTTLLISHDPHLADRSVPVQGARAVAI